MTLSCFWRKWQKIKWWKKKKNPIHQSIDKITDRLRPVLVGHRTGVHTGCQSEIIVNGKRLPLSIGRFSPASPWRQGSSGQKAGKPIGRRSDLRKPWPWEHGGLLRNISKYSLQLTPFLPLSRFARHTTPPSLNLDWTARYEQLYMWKWFEPWAIIYIIRWQWNFQMSTCPQNWSSNKIYLSSNRINHRTGASHDNMWHQVNTNLWQDWSAKNSPVPP